MSQRTGSPNALAQETSPYLLQHAHNPVQWHPWGAQALERARAENKPILLSVGYSACHWCHVMAHESFEDEPTARLMNELFVNVKVDREERPDLDKIYQTAHQLLTRRTGGWPLTMFLSPEDTSPFFGGTYFPRESRHGMPAFREVLTRVAEFYQEHREDIRRQSESLVAALAATESGGEAGNISPEPIAEACEILRRNFDPEHGGFGGAPKFPHPTNLERLMRQHAAAVAGGGGEPESLQAATFSLERMCLGGIYDHLGGGFCRYSVDERWMIPHFEKMLYDNGPLLALSAEAWQLTGEPLFREVAVETARWIEREMRSPEGGYYSSLDADSEGEEGRYYVWTSEEVHDRLEPEEYAAFAPRFGLDRPPNFEGRHWHLHVYESIETVAARIGRPSEEAKALVDRARGKLFVAREKRVRPGRDEKILTAWNALMIKGMAVAGRTLDEPWMVDSAERALHFLRARVWRDGRLLASYKDGRARFPAYLDDHAFLIDAVLALLSARWRTDELDLAIALAERLLEGFEDGERGGFYFTAHDHERLLHRPKPYPDDSLPSGNGVAAHALLRLGHLVGEPRYLAAAERALRAGWSGVVRFPHAHNAVLVAAEEYLEPPQTVILRGTGEPLDEWHRRTSRHYAPRRLAVAIPADAGPLPGLLAEREPASDGPVAWVCEGHVCRNPISSREELETALAATEVHGPG